ncbi:hypothetical protein ONS95_008578 [Cadophora gregata]|uniref:uncharacterized protein n=1 Tax=Cadophora gregata TaxID=51156 RepID=UPI0026DDAC13|nr:uncharacterized protein ONS95_008578 [Cadophora gregata]KAK0099824.1 hypothetical protein ONS95_008578 [Cadophora gregata]
MLTRMSSSSTVASCFPLAYAIVSCQKPIEVPADIIRAGLRAISAHECGQSRLFIFHLLDGRGLSALQPCFAVFARTESTKATSSGNILKTLENRFALLEVEEPVEPKTGPAPKVGPRVYELRAPAEDNKGLPLEAAWTVGWSTKSL